MRTNAPGGQFFPAGPPFFFMLLQLNRWGGNIGGSALADLNADTSLFFELKYVEGDWNGYAFTGGIFF